MRIRFLTGTLLFLASFCWDAFGQEKVITDLANAEVDLSLQKAVDSETPLPILLRITNTSSVELAITAKNASAFFVLRATSLRPMQLPILLADVSFGSLTASQPDSNRRSLKPGEIWEIRLDLETLIWVDANSSMTEAHKRVSPHGEMSLRFFLMPAGNLLDKDMLTVEGKSPKVFSSNPILIRF